MVRRLLPQFFPGMSPRALAAALNQLADAVSRYPGAFEATPPLEVKEDVGGVCYSLDATQGYRAFTARITAQPSISQALYSFVQVWDTSPPGGWATVPGGLTGTGNAEEIGGNLTVPADATTGAVVWMWPSKAKVGQYEFSYQSSAAIGVASAFLSPFLGPSIPSSASTNFNWTGATLQTSELLTLSGTNLQLTKQGYYQLNASIYFRQSGYVPGGSYEAAFGTNGIPPFAANEAKLPADVNYLNNIATFMLCGAIFVPQASTPYPLQVSLWQNTGSPVQAGVQLSVLYLSGSTGII